MRADGAVRRRLLLPVLRVRQQPAAGAAAAEQPLGGALRPGTPAGAGRGRRGAAAGGDRGPVEVRSPWWSRAWAWLCGTEPGAAAGRPSPPTGNGGGRSAVRGGRVPSPLTSQRARRDAWGCCPPPKERLRYPASAGLVVPGLTKSASLPAKTPHVKSSESCEPENASSRCSVGFRGQVSGSFKRMMLC